MTRAALTFVAALTMTSCVVYDGPDRRPPPAAPAGAESIDQVKVCTADDDATNGNDTDDSVYGPGEEPPTTAENCAVVSRAPGFAAKDPPDKPPPPPPKPKPTPKP
jgi:hypothetical protein